VSIDHAIRIPATDLQPHKISASVTREVYDQHPETREMMERRLYHGLGQAVLSTLMDGQPLVIQVDRPHWQPLLRKLDPTLFHDEAVLTSWMPDFTANLVLVYHTNRPLRGVAE
jgi:hypothetical protein